MFNLDLTTTHLCNAPDEPLFDSTGRLQRSQPPPPASPLFNNLPAEKSLQIRLTLPTDVVVLTRLNTERALLLDIGHSAFKMETLHQKLTECIWGLRTVEEGLQASNKLAGGQGHTVRVVLQTTLLKLQRQKQYLITNMEQTLAELLSHRNALQQFSTVNLGLARELERAGTKRRRTSDSHSEQQETTELRQMARMKWTIAEIQRILRKRITFFLGVSDELRSADLLSGDVHRGGCNEQIASKDDPMYDVELWESWTEVIKNVQRKWDTMHDAKLAQQFTDADETCPEAFKTQQRKRKRSPSPCDARPGHVSTSFFVPATPNPGDQADASPARSFDHSQMMMSEENVISSSACTPSTAAASSGLGAGDSNKTSDNSAKASPDMLPPRLARSSVNGGFIPLTQQRKQNVNERSLTSGHKNHNSLHETEIWSQQFGGAWMTSTLPTPSQKSAKGQSARGQSANHSQESAGGLVASISEFDDEEFGDGPLEEPLVRDVHHEEYHEGVADKPFTEEATGLFVAVEPRDGLTEASQLSENLAPQSTPTGDSSSTSEGHAKLRRSKSDSYSRYIIGADESVELLAGPNAWHSGMKRRASAS
ncbi:hypothetical protein HDU85_002075 [Gaertneriomyces sp. JEL0708]|nr:hypothetical protein HDU85_002075 [Gaertneriomyces sp. JEL0708]